MKELCPQSIIDTLHTSGVVAVVVFDDLKTVRPTMQALSNGGITAIELALRTPVSLNAIRIVAKEFPHILIGAGTVIRPEQVKQAQEAGAHFAVAPGLNRKVMDEALKQNFPFAPGITTASDIETALEYECTFLKFFPAEKIGGLAYLNATNGPYKYLGITYLPLGGLTSENAKSYLASDIINCIGGSWIARSDLINTGAFDVIEKNAREAMNTLKEVRK